jgi:hypothetical protein
MACPQKIIDWTIVDDLLASGCTGVEIASTFGIHPETLYMRTESEKGLGFSAYSQQKRAIGEKALRKKQQEVALKGNVSMLIWLGKQRLNQRETDVSKELDQMKVDLKALAEALGAGRAQRVEQSTSHSD